MYMTQVKSGERIISLMLSIPPNYRTRGVPGDSIYSFHTYFHVTTAIMAENLQSPAGAIQILAPVVSKNRGRCEWFC